MYITSRQRVDEMMVMPYVRDEEGDEWILLSSAVDDRTTSRRGSRASRKDYKSARCILTDRGRMMSRVHASRPPNATRTRSIRHHCRTQRRCRCELGGRRYPTSQPCLSLTFFSSSSLPSEAMTDVRASLSVLVRSEADMVMWWYESRAD